MTDPIKTIYQTCLDTMHDARHALDLAWPSTKAAAAEAKYLAHWFAVLNGPVEKPALPPKPEPVAEPSPEPVKRVRVKQVTPAERLAAIPAELRRQAIELKRLSNGLGLSGGMA